MARRRLNFISKIQNIQGDIFYANADIEKAFIDYFSNIYMENNIRNWLIGNLHWSCISPVQASNLTRNSYQIRLHELVPWFFLEYCQQSVNATYIALIPEKSMS